ncbi:hypothetical protein [Phenylobacterium sp.]|jgi:hypothetical protein|uniref:hypothetical protein n=1 Tax=Phenylobacterium sp. TaxID=1871053 RepID=UPI002E2ED102|nr:hypothetical protein [Phenylobacterium sp.]HEX2561211.1 hypothetical protein [Phenylobacterium sp.]
MRRHIRGLLVATAVAGGAGQAAAQAWLTVNERQARLDERIDRGVRTGALTREEAARLRADFRYLADLEARYRIGGLSAAERADLDRRFDDLSAQIGDEARDWDRGFEEPDDDRADWREDQWRGDRSDGFEARADRLLERIDRARREGRLTAPEAARLRAELDQLVRDEARYTAEIERRAGTLSARIRDGRDYDY